MSKKPDRFTCKFRNLDLLNASIVICIATVLSLLASKSASAQIGDSNDKMELFVTTSDLDVGTALKLTGGPPWSIDTLATTSGAMHARLFDKFLYTVNEQAGVIRRIHRQAIIEPRVYQFGSDSRPQDIHVVSDRFAYVTFRNHAFLSRLNLSTGDVVDVVDLSCLVNANQTMEVRNMERVGKKMYIQIAIFDQNNAAQQVPTNNRGVLAVIDLSAHELIDIAPEQPGVQGIALAGAPPHLKMQVVNKTLFVSTTDGYLDTRGGIEMVDLVSSQSIGFAVSEDQFADLGGFVMISATEGYFVFHTDLAVSTHLKHFSLIGGPDPGPEIIVLLGSAIDSLAFHEKTHRLFLPSGNPDMTFERGVYVFDTRTNLQVGAPIDTVLPPTHVITE